MTQAAIRLNEYATLPVFDVAHGVALGIALVNAVPKDAPLEVKQAVDGVRADTLGLQASWKASRDAPEPVDTRVVDTRVDNAWANLAQVLDSIRKLPGSNRSAIAGEVYDSLFSQGLTFLQLKYPAQWSECKLRLQRIDDQELEPKIQSLVGGREYLAEIRAAQAEYGEVLGIDRPKRATVSINLSESLGALRSAMETYVAQVVAWSRRSPEDAAKARAALEPIDNRREAAARAIKRSAEGAGSDAPEEPAPDVTPDTPVPAVP